MAKNLWTREEMILAFNLYLKLPFGQMHKHNSDIIALAKLIGRTPSSVGMRLGNYASCDPHLQARGIGGLKGGMKQVKPIWDEFYENQEELIFLSEKILATKQNSNIEEKYSNLLGDIKNLQGEEVSRLVKTRVNQSVFRTMVLNNYGGSCCISGIKKSELLVASHIVPWSKNEKERLNPRNGLCLNALHDKAFDIGLITVTADYEIKVSPRLTEPHLSNANLDRYFYEFHGKKITVPEKFVPSKDFLDYHHQTIFQK